ncbi:hypothetical protein MNBD_UNCLBAC01-1906 [hydrothermal vent metagenome]|uniref:Uncharacterized protein n=1 Tax=hydrothermal vent metagenome TaxID=652676 RepID=A0A3B1DUP0_9ZZZZ
MKSKFFIFFVMLFLWNGMSLANDDNQEFYEELTEEEWEIIENWEMLENLDFLKEDLDAIEKLGEDDE